MDDPLQRENLLSRRVIGCAIEAHKTLGGPGLLESVYEEALAWELKNRGIYYERQKQLPIPYKGTILGSPLRLDLLVENILIIECKATTEYNPIYEVQLLTYLRLTKLKLGLIINFGGEYVRDGLHRVINYPNA